MAYRIQPFVFFFRKILVNSSGSFQLGICGLTVDLAQLSTR
jgi:hypothetical protein